MSSKCEVLEQLASFNIRVLNTTKVTYAVEQLASMEYCALSSTRATISMIVQTNKTSDHTRYVIRVECLQRHWHVTRRYSQFRELRDNIQRVLIANHEKDLEELTCMFKDYNFDNFPRKHIFRSNRGTVIDERIAQFNDFLVMILQPFHQLDQPRECHSDKETIDTIRMLIQKFLSVPCYDRCSTPNQTKLLYEKQTVRSNMKKILSFQHIHIRRCSFSIFRSNSASRRCSL